MAGSLDLFDGQQLTGPSEYDSRYGTQIDTLQLHHATMTSLSGLIDMMMPGGRQVSANGAMGNDGTLIEVVPLSERAFTSATVYDRRCLTVECCNTTLAPDWGISDATHRRAGKLAADMFRAGLLGGINRTYIIGHNQVPGTYATSCPGPSFNLDLVVQYALEYLNPRKGVPPMSTLFDVLDDKEDRDYLLGSGGKIVVVPNSEKNALRLWWKGVSGGNPVGVYYGDLTKISKQITAANPQQIITGGPVGGGSGPSAADIAKAVLDGASGRLAA